MPVDAYSSYPHYTDHIRPVWDALADKGTFHTGKGLGPGPPVIIAGFPDLKRTRHRSHIFVEHGAGENWGGTDPHYSGGRGRESVILFVCPNPEVANRNLDRYPRSRAVVASPRLEWLAQLNAAQIGSGGKRDGRLRVVVSFHWDNHTWAETRSTLPLYSPHLKAWASDPRYELRGHAHPRISERARQRFGDIPFLDSFAEVVRWADVYAVDNSSTLFEAAALGLPVVLLNAPWHPTESKSYRFWKHADIGPHVNDPSEFGDAVMQAELRRCDYDDARGRMVGEIFPGIQGSTLRVVEAIESVTHDHPRTTGSTSAPTSGAFDSQSSVLGLP